MRLDRSHATLAAIAFIGLCSPLRAQTADARQHLEDLARANSLDVEGSQPWHLRMSFQLNDLEGKPKESGTIEEWWVSPQSFRLEIRSASYNLTIPHAASDPPEASTHTRESYLVNELLDQVIHPIPEYGNVKDLQVGEATRSFGKVELSCITVSRPPRTPAQFCFTPGTSILRGHIDEAQFTAVRNTMAKFRGIDLGLDNSLAYGDKVAISGHLETLESFHPDGSIALSTSPSGPPPRIPGVVLAGHAIRRPQPNYPETAREHRISGTVVLCATITKQGTISGVDVISSPNPLLTGSAIEAVKQWTYQPYLLNGSPIEVDTTITVNYNMGSGPVYIR